MKSLLLKIRGNHMLAMVLCCALPLGLIVMVSATGILGSWGYYALMLLLPAASCVHDAGTRRCSRQSASPRSFFRHRKE